MLLKLAGLLAARLVSSIALVCFVIFVFMPAPGGVALEVVKAILLLGGVSVIVALVSLSSFENQRARQKFDKNVERTSAQSEKDLQVERRWLEYRENLLKST